MSATTGRTLDGDAHLAQSIADILTTPLGTRVMRRHYGSALPNLIDAAANAATRARLYGATATALMRWEPRLRLQRVTLDTGSSPGQFTLEIEGRRTDSPRSTTHLSIPIHL